MFKLIKTVFFVSVVLFCFTACGTIFDYEGDCSVNHNIKFKYDKNMLNADAFANTVTSVNLFVFDVESGELISTFTAAGDSLSSPDFVLPIDLEPGEYDFVAWCGDALSDSNFVITPEFTAQSIRSNLNCKLNNVAVVADTAYLNHDIKRLWHGAARITLIDEPGTHTNIISLTKNTNNIRILLQNVAGKTLPDDAFEFHIHDNNGLLDVDNSVIPDLNICYSPWAISYVESDFDTESTNFAPQATRSSTATGVIAEFTTSRLVVENSPVLTVFNKLENKKVLSIPLKDYILMVKGKYNENMSDQEYLDREDEFVMTFFIDENGNWLSNQVIINSWHLVIQDEENLN